jgi:hypothetical protein
MIRAGNEEGGVAIRLILAAVDREVGEKWDVSEWP